MLLISCISHNLDDRLLVDFGFGLDVAVADVALPPTVRFLNNLLVVAEARGRPRFVRDRHLEAIPALNH